MLQMKKLRVKELISGKAAAWSRILGHMALAGLVLLEAPGPGPGAWGACASSPPTAQLLCLSGSFLEMSEPDDS